MAFVEGLSRETRACGKDKPRCDGIHRNGPLRVSSRACTSILVSARRGDRREHARGCRGARNGDQRAPVEQVLEEIACVETILSGFRLFVLQLRPRSGTLEVMATRALAQNPMLPGVTKLLAAVWEGDSPVPDSLPSPRDVGDEDAEWAFALTLLSLAATERSPESYVDQLLPMVASNPWRLDVLVTTAMRLGLRHDWIEELLTLLYPGVSSDGDRSAKARTLAALLDLLGRRISPLSEPSNWAALKLPGPPLAR